MDSTAPSHFAQCAPYIADALEYASGTHTLDDIRAGILSGRLQLWPGASSAVVTELVDHPQYRALHYFLAGGNLAELEAMYPVIMAWGREQGCTRATFIGRRGWERTFLARAGWKSTLMVFDTEL